jgi:uncharacterized protein YkwD
VLRRLTLPSVGTPPAGRHRRPAPPSRAALLVLLAVLALLLGSGTAISLTATRPPEPAPPAGAIAIGIGGAPISEPSPTEAPERPARADRPEPSPVEEPEESEPETGDEPVDEITALEDEVARLTNAERAEAGCDDLQIDERLRTAARGHSEDMAANDYFDHTGLDGRSPFDRMADAGYPDPAAENIAVGYRTPAEVMEGWMDSEGHRDNILECSYVAIGVGLAFDPDGRPYWTQDFGR